MKFYLRLQKYDCSGSTWTEDFDVSTVKSIDDANDFALGYVMGFNRGVRKSERIRILVVADSVGERLLRSLGSPWED